MLRRMGTSSFGRVADAWSGIFDEYNEDEPLTLGGDVDGFGWSVILKLETIEFSWSIGVFPSASAAAPWDEPESRRSITPFRSLDGARFSFLRS